MQSMPPILNRVHQLRNIACISDLLRRKETARRLGQIHADATIGEVVRWTSFGEYVTLLVQQPSLSTLPPCPRSGATATYREGRSQGFTLTALALQSPVAPYLRSRAHCSTHMKLTLSPPTFTNHAARQFRRHAAGTTSKTGKMWIGSPNYPGDRKTKTVVEDGILCIAASGTTKHITRTFIADREFGGSRATKT
jgi:hypothetical protein